MFFCKGAPFYYLLLANHPLPKDFASFVADFTTSPLTHLEAPWKNQFFSVKSNGTVHCPIFTLFFTIPWGWLFTGDEIGMRILTGGDLSRI
jgi:hypothetical protein